MEDVKIVQLFWDRDPDAIDHTARKYGDYCFSIARNILGNHEDAYECVNDTWLSAWRSMPPHWPDLLSTFLGKITRNAAYNRYKSTRAEKRGGSQTALVMDELSECVAGKYEVEQEIEYKELVAAIDAFLDTLSEDARRIFVCRYWYTDSISDIARQFRKRENTVTKMLSRSREKLRQYLLERGFQV